MKRLSILLIILVCGLTAIAQSPQIKGIVVDELTGNPLKGITVYLKSSGISAVTDQSGTFVIPNVKKGGSTVSFFSAEVRSRDIPVQIKSKEDVDLGIIKIQTISGSGTDDGAVFTFSESQLNDDDDMNSVSSSLIGGSDDVFMKHAGFTFSPMRYNFRGYSQESSSTYINGVNFNDGERGRFNYSMLGGMNPTFKNRDVNLGITPSNFSFGDVGGATNMIVRPSKLPVGSSAGVAFTNRSYRTRAIVSHGTGLMSNGWALYGSAIFRYANEGQVEGTFYNSWGYFLGAEKVFNEHHSLNFITFGAPTRRAQQGATTREAYELAGSIYYNPYWGMQGDQKRNSRIVNSYDPTLIVSHEWTIDPKRRLNTSLAVHYNNYGSTAVNFYNATDPRPDYYRYLPSYQLTDEGKEQATQAWKNDINIRQIDWNNIYQTNYNQNAEDDRNGRMSSARYMSEERHNNLVEGIFNSTYLNMFSNNLKIKGGLDVKLSKGMHFKTVDDLLGGRQWIDIDQFAERDFPDDPMLTQNDLDNPNRVVKEGDVFGYNYDINVVNAGLWLQNEWRFRKVDLYYAAQLNYTQYNRYGYMRNGRAPLNSKGASKDYFFVDPSFKVGGVWKINGNHFVSANLLTQTKAPLANNAYISPRIKSNIIKGLTSEKIFSGDLSYNVNTSRVRGRLTAFYTQSSDVAENNGYYSDEYFTYVNHLMYGMSKQNAGIELGVKLKLTSLFSLTFVGQMSENFYTSNAKGVVSFENGSKADITGDHADVLSKGLYANSSPQNIASLKLDFFHPKMWFADITATYYDKNYLDFAPSKRTIKGYDLASGAEISNKFVQAERLPSGFLVDASIGKLIYFKNKKSMNINLSMNNLLNNTEMISGGFEQARLDKVESGYKFQPKYYFVQGFNFYLNVGYKF